MKSKITWQFIPSVVGPDKYALVQDNTIIAMTSKKWKSWWWQFKYAQYVTRT